MEVLLLLLCYSNFEQEDIFGASLGFNSVLIMNIRSRSEVITLVEREVV